MGIKIKLFFLCLIFNVIKNDIIEKESNTSVCENYGCDVSDSLSFRENDTFGTETYLQNNSLTEESRYNEISYTEVNLEKPAENSTLKEINDEEKVINRQIVDSNDVTVIMHSEVGNTSDGNTNMRNSSTSSNQKNEMLPKRNGILKPKSDQDASLVGNNNPKKSSGVVPEDKTVKNNSSNEISLSNTKEIFNKARNPSHNLSEVCECDLKVGECDINCCCDQDCNANMRQVFTTCKDAGEEVNPDICVKTKSLFKINLESRIVSYGNGLFCVVRSNFSPQLAYSDEKVIDSVKDFQRKLSEKKLYSYATFNYEIPKIQNTSYKIGDYLWTFVDNRTLPFGVPRHNINMRCDSVKSATYLMDYTIQCLQSIPDNKEKCLKTLNLGMHYYLRNMKIIKSPDLFQQSNSSHEMCNSTTCVGIVSYICPENSNSTSCVEAPPRHPLWEEDTCKNMVSSIEYHIYHNGTQGVKEARAYFSLRSMKKKPVLQFFQTIKLNYFWVKTSAQSFSRSGNPGYIIGKPLMAGRKVYSNNETASLKKEAIELSLNPNNWLTMTGRERGMCSSVNRKSINFGEDLYTTCSLPLGKYEFVKKKCLDLQDDIFNYLIGEEFAEIKSNNRFNKYVATFGNSKVEETGDWVQVIIDMLPMVSSQVALISHSEVFICKNIITDLFIDVAYGKIGSFEKPQNKVLGVRYYFGSPRKLTFFPKPNSSHYNMRQIVKISTYVRFIDLTTKPVAEFAETPGFEAKLPHDFFYPFFSKGFSIRPNSLMFAAFVFVKTFLIIFFLI